jgi:hypothetical protein
MYALDAVGQIINTTNTRSLAPLGEEHIRVVGLATRPVREVILVGIADDNSAPNLSSDVNAAQAPLFIKEIKIPIGP